MADENKTVNKQKIDINTYRFPSGQTIDEILKTQTSWATDEGCLSNMIDSNWRAVDDFITDKEKELAKKFLIASNNPEVDLKLLAVQSEVATQYLCQKHTNQELWEKARNDPKGMTRPFSKDVVNIENQINFSYELPSWIKEHIEEIPNNWFQKTPAQLQKEQEREDIQTTVALNNIAKDIVIEPYSRKPEDIEAMKSFVANVSGNDIENITNDQAQAFINNLGTTEEAYLTAKANGTFEYTYINPYSSDIYKTSESKEILSIIEDNADHHILRCAPESEARKNCIKDYEFIHLINEKMNEIEASTVPNRKDIAYTNLMEWATQSTFDEADGLEGSEIFEKYENEPVPIAVLPKEALIAFDNVTDRNIYSGKAYFIDHMVNHHDELNVSEYKNFQDDLDNYDKIYNDPKNGSIVFEKNKNNKKYSIAVKELEGNLVFYKSYHYGDKTKKRFIEIDLEKLRKEKSVEVGKSPISPSDYSESGRPLSALTDNINIAQFPKMSNAHNENDKITVLENQLKIANKTIQEQNKQLKEQDELLNGKGSVKVNGVERKFELGLKHAFPEAVKRIDIENQRNKDLTAAYNELAKSKLNDISPISPSDDGNTYS